MNLFIFDFDGTITLQDTTDLILEIPGNDQIWEIEEEWKQGNIPSYKCMKEQARFLEGITTTKIYQHLNKFSKMDPNFPLLVQNLNELNFYTIILSEGYDISLKFHRVQEYIKDIHCSKLLVEKGRLTGELKVSNEKIWDYNNKCIGCCICKVDFLKKLIKRFSFNKTFAVGDGRSDECLFKYVDISFSLNPKFEATYQVRDLSEILTVLVE
jgi:HAD superfamily phosphoserine phosphatase-like hydrolase